MKNTSGFESRKYVIDVICGLFLVYLSWEYYKYIILTQVPMWDAVVYLENARNWLNGESIFETFRPPLISWIIAIIWRFTGENWIIIKPLSAIFAVGSGILLYATLRKYKNGLFALLVVVLTMINTQVFFYNTHIYTEGISLFFLVATLYLLKSEKENNWMLAGVAIGLTFASRYYIVVQAVTILLVECLIRKNSKIFIRTMYGMLPTISLTILIMYLKTDTFQLAIEGAHVGYLSLFYLTHSIDIWGPIFYLVPIVFLFRSTYTDKYNYVFIAWYIVGIIFWSLNAGNYQYRFAIQFTPAVYYLAILAIENIIKGSKIITLKDILYGIRSSVNFVARFMNY